jgi:hypothetical protein
VGGVCSVWCVCGVCGVSVCGVWCVCVVCGVCGVVCVVFLVCVCVEWCECVCVEWCECVCVVVCVRLKYVNYLLTTISTLHTLS